MPLGKFPALLDHSCCVRTNGLGADGPIHDLGDLLNDLFVTFAMGFAEQGRIGGHAAEYAPACRLAYLFDVRSIKKNAHGFLFPSSAGHFRYNSRGETLSPWGSYPRTYRIVAHRGAECKPFMSTTPPIDWDMAIIWVSSGAPFMSTNQELQQFLLNPFDWYRVQREISPVSHSQTNGVWSVFGYENVQRTLSDYTNFSSSLAMGGSGNMSNPLGASMLSSDPPRHRQLRSLVTQAFTPRTVALLEPRITAIVQELLDGVAGEFDLIDTLAYPVPVIVIAELLGIPPEDRDLFKLWSDAIVVGPRAAGMAGRDPQHEMSDYFLRLIQERQLYPDQQDLIRGLLAARNEEGQHLRIVDVLGFCVLLLVAGNETTTNLI